MTTAATANGAETPSPPAHDVEGSAEQLLAALPSAVGSARRFVRHTLELWQLEALIDTAEMVIDTLVGDAVVRTGVAVEHPGYADLRGKPLSLLLVRVRALEDRVLIEVHDEDATPPWTRDTTTPAAPASTAPGARALTYDMVSSGGTIARAELAPTPGEHQSHTRVPELPRRIPGRSGPPASPVVEAERDQELLRRVHVGLQQIPVHKSTMPGMIGDPAA